MHYNDSTIAISPTLLDPDVVASDTWVEIRGQNDGEFQISKEEFLMMLDEVPKFWIEEAEGVTLE